MSQSKDQESVVHRESRSRGVFRIGDYARMTYTRPSDGVIKVDHTFVDEAYRRRGLAHQLYFAMVDFARQNQRQVIAVCPFVVDTFEKNPQDADVLVS